MSTSRQDKHSHQGYKIKSNDEKFLKAISTKRMLIQESKDE
jgi:hypothetical protein